MDSKHVPWAEGAVEMLQSLNVAVQAAGGTAPSFARLCSMTVVELLSLYGPNRIRFVYCPSDDRAIMRAKITDCLVELKRLGVNVNELVQKETADGTVDARTPQGKGVEGTTSQVQAGEVQRP